MRELSVGVRKRLFLIYPLGSVNVGFTLAFSTLLEITMFALAPVIDLER